MVRHEFLGRRAEELRMEDGFLDSRLGEGAVLQTEDSTGVVEGVKAVRYGLGDPVDRFAIMCVADEDVAERVGGRLLARRL